jgi:spore coat protein U-like protein
MFKKVALAALLAAVVSTNAEAGSATGSFTVSATFNPTCGVSTSRNLDFGTIGGTGAIITSSTAYATVDIACSQGVAYTVTLASATPTGGPVATGFNMLGNGGTEKMSYRLHYNTIGGPIFDAAGTQIAANGTAGASPTSLFLYGEIPVQAPLASWGTGSTNYTDIVQVTIGF